MRRTFAEARGKKKRVIVLGCRRREQAETLEDANNVICTRIVPARRSLGVDRTAMVGFA